MEGGESVPPSAVGGRTERTMLYTFLERNNSHESLTTAFFPALPLWRVAALWNVLSMRGSALISLDRTR